jgi:hypothetical protein
MIMPTKKSFPLLFAAIVTAMSLTCSKHSSNVTTTTATTTGKTTTDSVNIVLTQEWTGTNLYLLKGQSFTVTASGNMNWYTGSTCTTCMSTPAGGDCSQDNTSGFSFPGLQCWSLIGMIRGGAVFEVGDSYSGVADSSGELYLGVNDNNYPDNTGSWVAVVKTTPPGCNDEANTYTPKLGDVSNLTAAMLEPQDSSAWCWASMARFLMFQASGINYPQCNILNQWLTKLDCCNNPNACNVGLKNYQLPDVLSSFGFSRKYSYNAVTGGFTPGDLIYQLSVLNRPIAFEINMTSSITNGYSGHFEVIYGYYYVGDSLYVRIWDPRGITNPETWPPFRCNLYSKFPQPIVTSKNETLSISILDYIYDVQR